MPIPKPRKGEKQKDFVSRCVKFVKKENPTMDDKQASAICFTAFKESKKQSSQESKDWRYLNFSVPIEQSSVDGDKKDFLIKGVAINSTVTRNGVEFVSDELKMSASSLRNKPILKDHTNSVDSIVGRTTQNVEFNEVNESIDFEAKIVDKSMQEKISQGLVQSVSVGAMVQDIEEATNDDGEVTHFVARGIDFVELSLVAVPADPNAGLATAIMQSFKLKQGLKSDDKVDTNIQEQIADKDKKIKMDELEKIQKENAELKAKLDKIEQDKLIEQEVEKRVAEKLAAQAKTDSTQDTETDTTQEVDETQGEVGNSDDQTDVSEDFDNYLLSRGNRGYSFSVKEYPKSCKRLI